MAIRVAQDILEILARPDGDALSAQAAVEVLTTPEGRGRAAQSAAEVLTYPATALARTSQMVVEILLPAD